MNAGGGRGVSAYRGDAHRRQLLAFLYSHAVRPEFTCRFVWSPGALAMWDNRCLQHFAINDYAGHRRELRRTTVLGEAPIPVGAEPAAVRA
nr:TauD/TfdA family dioxygenase [Vineibacter terrae]